MTCLIGLRTVGGHSLIAADTCLSRPWRVAGQEKRLFRDDVQKIYALSPDIVLGVTTDNMRAARSLLREAQPRAQEIASQLRSSGRYWPAMSGLERFLSFLWAKFGGPTAGLVVGVSTGSGARLFAWDSRYPRAPSREVASGEHIIMGSIGRLPELERRLEMNLTTVARLRADRRPLDADSSSLQLFDKVTQVFADEAARVAGVGGLVQMAYHDGSQFVMPAFDSDLYLQGEGVKYAVSIEYDGNRWVQVDRLSGRRVPVMRLDEHHLSVHGDNRFTY